MREPKSVGDDVLLRIVKAVEAVSDRGHDGLLAWGRLLIEAHQRAPQGLTIEVGSRLGGSAVLFGALLEAMYGVDDCPPLWTVDPYGSKPYEGGDTGAAGPPIYDADVYAAAKHNLVEAHMHSHWMMESREFFRRLDGLSYWRAGEKTMRCLDTATGKALERRIGEAHTAGRGSASFILLDGEHSAYAIANDFRAAALWLKPSGCIVVDNLKTDPKSVDLLFEMQAAAFLGEGHRWTTDFFLGGDCAACWSTEAA